VEPAARQELLQSHEDEMRQTLDHLADEIKSLGIELQRLRKVTDRNAQTMELLLSEERLSRVEDKIQDAIERRSQLDAREQDLQRRMRNIPNELLTRGGVRREEAEAAIKGEIQRALDEVHNQQSSYQHRLVELNAQAERLRARVETLRKKVDPVEPKTEKQDQ
jgi:chromosome segregation ATPase